MNKSIRYPILAVMAILATSVGEQLAAQPNGNDQAQCPPQCGVRIDVPGNPSQEPGSSPETLIVDDGQMVTFATNVRARVVFTGKTPFVNDRGNRVFQFQVDDSGETRLRVSANNECMAEPGCKYIVIDATNPGRPARDPYIIVRP